jgi:hypothetical protein
MHKNVRNRAVEFKKRFGPLLKELKLRVKVYDDPYFFKIRMWGRRVEGKPTPFSPVKIFLSASNNERGGEIAWDAATVAIDHWYPKALGQTGWVHWRRWDQTGFKWNEIDGDPFDWLEGQIREHGAVIIPYGEGNSVDFPELADVFWVANESIEDLAIIKSHHYYHGVEEALTFLDLEGRRVHLTFGGAGNLLLIDGEPIGSFSTTDIYKIAEVARDMSNGRSSNPSWFLSPLMDRPAP